APASGTAAGEAAWAGGVLDASDDATSPGVEGQPDSSTPAPTVLASLRRSRPSDSGAPTPWTRYGPSNELRVAVVRLRRAMSPSLQEGANTIRSAMRSSRSERIHHRVHHPPEVGAIGDERRFDVLLH